MSADTASVMIHLFHGLIDKFISIELIILEFLQSPFYGFKLLFLRDIKITAKLRSFQCFDTKRKRFTLLDINFQMYAVYYSFLLKTGEWT